MTHGWATKELRRLPAVERRLLGNRMFVQPRGASVPAELGGSAPVIWELLDSHHSVNAIRDVLVRRFDDDPDAIVDGIETALGQLEAAGLIEVVGP